MGEILDQGLAARRKSYELLVAKANDGKALTAGEISAMSRFEKELAAAGLDLPKYLDSIEEVEAYTGYKSRTIYKAIETGELARLADNRFLVAAVDDFLAAKGKRPQVRMVDGDQDDDPDDGGDGTKYHAGNEEAKYRHFRAKREQIIVKRLEGELIDLETANREFVNRIHEFRTGLLMLRHRVSHKIAEIAKVEVRVIDEILDADAKALLTALSRKVRIHVD
jgi:hypothetical protein